MDTLSGRPALRYPGAKWNLGEWVISYLPYGGVDSYTEAYGGSAGVLIQKPRHTIETYNDLSGDVVNFFKMLRDCPDDLIRSLELTPYARSEFELSKNPPGDISDLERARLTFIRHWMSISGGRKSVGGWRAMINEGGRGNTPAYDMTNISHLYIIAERFRGVQIEQLPARDLLLRYDGPRTLHYVDPPYVASTRTEKSLYHHELKTEKEHGELLDVLLGLRGMVVLSGYKTVLYADVLESKGWVRRDTETQANTGVKRLESLWLSPRTWDCLQQDVSAMPLFAAMGKGKLFCD